MKRMKVISGYILVVLLFIGCTGMQQTSQKGAIQETIRKVTPKDIKSHTQKIITGEHQFVMYRTEQTQSSLFFQTEWKSLTPTGDEEEMGISDPRLRIKLRSQKLRRGMDEYEVHNLKFTAELQGVTPESDGDYVNIAITPEREDYIDEILTDYKTEFRSGVMEY